MRGHSNFTQLCLRMTKGLMIIPSSTRKSLEGERFHVIVIGGGIVGSSIARQCARGGKRTLLLEQQDFGSGSSSRSTRLVTAGIQSVQNGEIGLIRESLREQERLLRDHPHLVHPTNIVMAFPENGRCSVMRLRAGLWLHRRLAGDKTGVEGFNRFKLERELDSGKHWSLFNYEGAQCEFPERIVAEWLADAADAGGIIRNHTEVIAINVFHGRAKGLLLRDRLSNREEPVEANWIINATGPWADRMCHRSRIKMKSPLLAAERGSHLVLPRFPHAPEAAIRTAHEGKPFYVVPWNDQILVGSTSVADNGDPGSAEPSEAETNSLLQAFTSVFPKSKVSSQDIRYTYAGMRARPFSKKSDHAVSDHCYVHNHQEDGAAQMLSIVGGSLATAFEVGRQCAAMIGVKSTPGAATSAASPGSFDPLLDQWALELANAGGISEAAARGIVEWYGKRSPTIAQLANTSVQMRAPLCRHTDHIVAEAVHAFSNEKAVSLADVLLRRVPVALGRCWSAACSRDAAMRIGAVVGWNEYESAAQVEAFEIERSNFLRKPRNKWSALHSAAD
jgi:glycerol-3-phosphate dehydrogenase